MNGERGMNSDRFNALADAETFVFGFAGIATKDTSNKSISVRMR